MIYDIPQDFVGFYDTDKIDFTSWTRRKIQELHPEIKALSQLHNYLNLYQIQDVLKYLQNSAGTCSEFQSLINTFFTNNVAPIVETNQYLIQREPNFRVAVPNQDKTVQRTYFHNDMLVGGGRGCMTAWVPLTESFETNSLHIANLQDSRNIIQRYFKHQWSLNKFDTECQKICEPVTCKPGQFILFDQERIHGSLNNTTDITRLSFDARLLLKNKECYQRIPGGYFVGTDNIKNSIFENQKNKDNILIYLNRNTAFTKSIPFNMQTELILKFCEKNNLKHSRIGHDFVNSNWLPGLDFAIDQSLNGIVLTSIFSLPDDIDTRTKICNKAIKQNMPIYFANEELCLTHKQDIEKINEYYEYAVWQDGDFPWE